MEGICNSKLSSLQRRNCKLRMSLSLSIPWLDMDKEELELQYSPSQWSKRLNKDLIISEHIRVTSEGSAASKADVDCQLGLAYGDTDQQKIDIFGADSLPVDAPTLIFIHGGYWQLMSLEQSSFMASCFVKAGAVVAIVGYELCPKVTFGELIEQVKKGVSKAIQFATERGSRGIYISGHSAGGHLTSMMMTQNWSALHGQENSPIKGAIIVSGIFDLRPIVKTYVNDPLYLTSDSAWKHSPARLIPEMVKHNGRVPQYLLVAGDESPEFIRQSLLMCQSLKESGMIAECQVLQNYDHFHIIEDLRNPDSQTTKAFFSIMGISGEQE